MYVHTYIRMYVCVYQRVCQREEAAAAVHAKSWGDIYIIHTHTHTHTYREEVAAAVHAGSWGGDGSGGVGDVQGERPPRSSVYLLY